MTLVGYARVSRQDQDASIQEHLLRAAGCTQVFRDNLSGMVSERPGLVAALATLQRGDVLVVWKLDRLGRSLHDLVFRARELEKAGIELRCLTQPIDTTTSMGRFFFAVMAAMAELERDLISERTKAALDRRRAQGKRLGPPSRLNPDQVAWGHPPARRGALHGAHRPPLRLQPDDRLPALSAPCYNTRRHEQSFAGGHRRWLRQQFPWPRERYSVGR